MCTKNGPPKGGFFNDYNFEYMIENIFTKLVSIASPSGSESEAGKFVKTELENLGAETHMDSEGNVMARFAGKGEPVLLSGHLDTVQGLTMVKPVVTNGVIKSRGNTILGGDNKASVAAILYSLQQIRSKKRKNVEVVLSVREETDGGVSKIDLSWVKSKAGISADSGEPIGTIISDTPFMEGFQITVMGKSSHSSEPENGINALSLASFGISNFKWGKIDEFSTANIGIIQGGSAVNTTPGQIILIGEIRSYIKENLNIIKADIENSFKTAAKVFKGKVRFSYSYYCDGYSYKDNDASNRAIRKIYKKLKIKESFKKSFGGSDANFFNSNGISVVDIGDGVYSPHTNQEFVSIKDLNSLADIFSTYISA